MQFTFGQNDTATLDTDALRDQFRGLFDILDAVLTERGRDIEVQRLKNELTSLQTQSAEEITKLKNQLYTFQRRISDLEVELYHARQLSRERLRQLLKSRPKTRRISSKGTAKATRAEAKRVRCT